MHLSEELVEKTKKLFPEAKDLHNAVETRDVTLIMGCLNEMMTRITNITNEWILVEMQISFMKDEIPEDNLQGMQEKTFRAA